MNFSLLPVLFLVSSPCMMVTDRVHSFSFSSLSPQPQQHDYQHRRTSSSTSFIVTSSIPPRQGRIRKSCSSRSSRIRTLSKASSCPLHFVTTTTTTTTTTCLRARPPPSSSFNLEEIEAYESMLDQQLDDENADDDLDDVDEESVVNGESTTTTKTYVVPDELSGRRIDTVLASLLAVVDTEGEPSSTTASAAAVSFSRSTCGNLVADGHVALVINNNDDGTTTKLIDRKSFKVVTGQTIQVTLPSQQSDGTGMTEIIAENIPLDIIYEDEHMIVINKAANRVVHPAPGNRNGTIVNALAYYLAQVTTKGSGDFVDGALAGANDMALACRPGVVHRLDKGTTGVLVVAKTRQAHTALSEAFAQRKVRKTYLAITVGNPGRQVKIDKPIGRHPVHRQRMRVVPDPSSAQPNRNTNNRQVNNVQRNQNQQQRQSMSDDEARPTAVTGRRALSYVDTIASDGKLSLVRVRILTGRTHQIRVHLQDHNTPVYGDDVYGVAAWNKRLVKSHRIERPLLHAYELELDHPITGQRMTFTAPLSEDMVGVAKTIVGGDRDHQVGNDAAEGGGGVEVDPVLAELF